jgi:hypothetical protein
MTKTAFLAALRAAMIEAGHSWLNAPVPETPGLTKLDRFVSRTAETIEGTANLVDIASPSFVQAWRAIGGKGKPTYKGLRALAA